MSTLSFQSALSLTAIALLGACSQPQTTDGVSQTEQPGKVEEAATTASAPEPGNITKNSDKSVDQEIASDKESVSPAGYKSAYTDVPEEKSCTIIEQVEEGSSLTLRCTGYGAIPLIIKHGDLRSDLDAGKEGEFRTQGEFNKAVGKIEWRLGPDGKPFAMIYRLKTFPPEGIASRSWLIVETIGTKAMPGCQIAEVPGAAANANEVARSKADAILSGKVSCLPI